MDTERRSSGLGKLFFIFLLILIIIGLVGYILVDKKVIKLPVEIGNIIGSGDSTDKNDTVKEEKVSLSIEDASVIELYKNAHYSFNIASIDQYVFNNKKLTLADMDEHYKIGLAGNIFYKNIEYNYLDNSSYVTYEAVKNAYEKIFGPNTFKHIDKFDLNCGPYEYDAVNKTYVNKADGCGGTTVYSLVEEMISATKYKDRIEITSAALFYNGAEFAIYKDYNFTNKIADFDTTGQNSYEPLKNYVKENKDNLQQYTYTFKLNEDGFYYYNGVERTKE